MTDKKNAVAGQAPLATPPESTAEQPSKPVIVGMSVKGVSIFDGGFRDPEIITNDRLGIDWLALQGGMTSFQIEGVRVEPQFAPESETRVGITLVFDGITMAETTVPLMRNGPPLGAEYVQAVERSWYAPSGVARTVLRRTLPGATSVLVNKVLAATDVSDIKAMRQKGVEESDEDIRRRLGDFLTDQLAGHVAIIRDNGKRASRKNEDRSVRDQDFLIIPRTARFDAVGAFGVVTSITLEKMLAGDAGQGLLLCLQYAATERGWANALPATPALAGPMQPVQAIDQSAVTDEADDIF